MKKRMIDLLKTLVFVWLGVFVAYIIYMFNSESSFHWSIGLIISGVIIIIYFIQEMYYRSKKH